jgi:serine/threonine-protein kinase HipA
MVRDEMVQVLLADGAAARRVGRLRDAGTGPHFEYDPDFLAGGVELAPLTLPLRSGVVGPGPRFQRHLRGLFADSIPDGFGLKVLHQALKRAGRDPFSVSPLELLTVVGDRGMGALCYRPVDDIWGDSAPLPSLAELAKEAARLDADDVTELPDALRRTAGASGGARPKVTLALHADGRVHDASLPLAAGFRHVLVKFRAATDPAYQVELESAYLAMAAAAGLDVPSQETVPLGDAQHALVLDRFDRVGAERRHVQSFAAILEADFRVDLVDYATLLERTMRLTRDFSQVAQALRLAAFNVMAGNRDDHIKNVSFLMDPAGRWRMAPAYDLTFGGSGGYHAMSCDGESRAPDAGHVERVGLRAGFDRHQVRAVIDQVTAAFGRWDEFADAAGVPAAARRDVARVLHRARKTS